MSEFSVTQGQTTYPVIEALISFPRMGRWICQCRIDSSSDSTDIQVNPISASGSISFQGAGMSITGSIVDELSGYFNQENRLYIIAGMNGMKTVVSGQDYSSPTMNTLVGDLNNLTGESLSSNTQNSILNYSFPRFTRTQDTADTILSTLVRLHGQDLVWRFEPSGKLLLVQDAWTSVTFASTPVPGVTNPDQSDGDLIILNENFANKKREFWVDQIDLNVMTPGVTWGEIDSPSTNNTAPTDRKIDRIEFFIKDQRTRLTAWFQSTELTTTFFPPGAIPESDTSSTTTTAGRSQDGLINLVSAITKRNNFSALFPGSISACDTTKLTVDVSTDSPFFNGITAVPFRHVSPGILCIPSVGSRCILTFENNNPSRPIVLLWEMPDSNGNGGTDSITMNASGSSLPITAKSITLGTSGDGGIALCAGVTTPAPSSGRVNLHASSLVELGDPDGAQFALLGDDVTSYLGDIKTAVNAIISDLQTISLHTHTGTAGPYPASVLPSPSLSSIGTETDLDSVPDQSTLVKNS